MSQINDYLRTKPSLTRAVVCFLVDGNQVTLGVRKKVSLGLGANLISGVGGKVGDVAGLEKETDDEALVREVKEELGVQITEFHKVGEITFLFPNKPKWNQFVTAYIVTRWAGTPVETESIKPTTVYVDTLPFDRMWDDYKYWASQVLSGQRIKATFLYGNDNEKVIEKDVITT
jgi:8-oxo-dGTP diphosphatase